MPQTTQPVTRSHRLPLALAALVALWTAAGCGGGSDRVPGPTARTQTQPTAPTVGGGHRGGGGSGRGGGQAAATLPADWPADVPAPPGVIQGATHAGGRHWTVRSLAQGSAQDVMRRTVDTYRSAGFATETDAILHNAAHRVTINVENRDHSAAETFVVVAVAGL